MGKTKPLIFKEVGVKMNNGNCMWTAYVASFKYYTSLAYTKI